MKINIGIKNPSQFPFLTVETFYISEVSWRRRCQVELCTYVIDMHKHTSESLFGVTQKIYERNWDFLPWDDRTST